LWYVHYYTAGCKRSRPHGSRTTPSRDLGGVVAFYASVRRGFADGRSTRPSLSFANRHNPAASVGGEARPDSPKVSPSLSETAAGVIRGLSLLTERNRGDHDRDAVATVMQR